ncbi:MAG: hypothetical protein ABI054_09365 [Planctomycetota bacterium]
MITSIFFCAACTAAAPSVPQAQPGATAAAPSDRPALTIYNQDFAVVREVIPLTLKQGVNSLSYAGMTAHLEPDSVILRDPSNQHRLQILEQNYRNDPITQQRLLDLYEGQTIDFTRERPDLTVVRIKGRIVRSGYLPPAFDIYGNPQYQPDGQPVIEVDGSLQFQLPGIPVFPSLKDDTILKPRLDWLIETDAPATIPVELAYVTGGMSWHADYNIVSPEKGDLLDLVGWITIANKSGKTFDDARIKLLAGDVNKLLPQNVRAEYGSRLAAMKSNQMDAVVTEKSFDEYHLYTLARTSTLRDAETKQVEFVRAAKVPSQRLYVYDGAAIDPNQWNGYDAINLRTEPSYGTQMNKKVWVMREFKNSAAQGLGIPLPKGRVRFYRQGDDQQLEFTGENTIDHTPKDELLRIYTGNAFDLVGERTRTDFKVDTNAQWVDETFEIKLRNHKQEEVEFRVVENLYRWVNWEIRDCETPFTKTSSQKIEFRVKVPADGEASVKYLVHYSW